MSTHYLVTWTIDINADSPLEAAQKALAIQRDPTSIATYFAVRDVKAAQTTEIDLEDFPS